MKFLAIVRMSFLFGLKLGFVTHHYDAMLCDLTDVEMSRQANSLYIHIVEFG